MASSSHMATPEDDARHRPGPQSMPLWSESYWFAFYDPKVEIGVTVRLGMHTNKGEGNMYLLIAHKGAIVHSLTDTCGPVPPWEEGRLGAHGYTIDFERPVERFRLRYQRDHHAMDVVWEGFSPAYMYQYPPNTTSDQIPRHIEHAGTVKGTITLNGTAYQIDCLGHRDHSWGGERDWAKMPRWDYLSGEIDKDFWFNAVEVHMRGLPQPIYVGGIWDGKEVMNIAKVEMDVRTTEGGTRQQGVDVTITDERGREHRIAGEEVLAIAPVWFGRTCVRDGFTRYRYGDRVGYGILEHAYLEQD